MDILTDLGKAALTLFALGVILVLIPVLFMFVFTIATDIDENLNRE